MSDGPSRVARAAFPFLAGFPSAGTSQIAYVTVAVYAIWRNAYVALTLLPMRKYLRFLWLLPAWLLVTLVAWSRLPSAARRTVWAEDGGVFLRDIFADGVWRSVIKPYDGYLHVIPRVIVGAAYKLAPVDAFAVSVSFLSCAAVAAVCLAVFFLAKPVFESPWVRAMLAAIPLLLPVAPIEVLGNAANLHWYLLWLSPWLLIRNPLSIGGRAGFFVAALITAASEVITGLFVPLALWMMWRRKNYWAPLGLIVGVGLQVLTTLGNPRPDSLRVENSVDLWSVVIGFVVQPVSALWHADSRTLVANLVAFGGVAVLLPLSALILLFVLVLVFGRTEWKVGAIYAVSAAFACWAASVLVNAKPMFNYSQFAAQDWQQGFQYIRYAVAPGMFLLVLVPLAIASLIDRFPIERKTGAKLGVPAAFVVFAFVMLSDFFPVFTTRDAGPEWSPGVANARAACSSNVQLGNSPVTVAPSSWKFAQVQVPCAVLIAPADVRPASAEGVGRLP